MLLFFVCCQLALRYWTVLVSSASDHRKCFWIFFAFRALLPVVRVLGDGQEVVSEIRNNSPELAHRINLVVWWVTRKLQSAITARGAARPHSIRSYLGPLVSHCCLRFNIACSHAYKAPPIRNWEQETQEIDIHMFLYLLLWLRVSVHTIVIVSLTSWSLHLEYACWVVLCCWIWHLCRTLCFGPEPSLKSCLRPHPKVSGIVFVF